MAIMPGAEWRGPLPSSNYHAGGAPAPEGIVVHHIVGSLASADSLFHTPGAGSSAHFGVGRDGHVVQWVDTADVAYAQCAGNWSGGWVSIENEADATEPLTAEQVNACAAIARWLGIAAVAASSPLSGGVAYHRQFPGDCSIAWGLTECPGDAIVAQIPAVVAAIYPPPPPPPPPPSEDDVQVHAQVTDTKGTDHLFVLGNDRSLYTKAIAPDGTQSPPWPDWLNLGGAWSSLPVATLHKDAAGNGVIVVSGRGTDNGMYFRRFFDDGGGWENGPRGLGGQVINP